MTPRPLKALVVYESMFGNTEQVARAITTGLSKYLEVELTEVTHAPAAITGHLDLIVVGGPTHAFSMTRPSTREDAVEQGATHDTETGIREWLEHLPAGHHSEVVATFDTRIDKVRHLPGSAAKGAAKSAHKHGYASAAKAASFYVEDVNGPLLDGELDRAQRWGEDLGAGVKERAGHASP